ncbi:hypothetical protein V7798_00910 [Rhizobium laguerreae]
MAAEQGSRDVERDIVVIVGPGLNDRVSDLSDVAVENMPIGQHAGRSGRAIENDQAKRPSSFSGMRDADTWPDRIEPLAAQINLFLCNDFERRTEGALQDIRRDHLPFDLDCLRNAAAAE